MLLHLPMELLLYVLFHTEIHDVLAAACTCTLINSVWMARPKCLELHAATFDCPKSGDPRDIASAFFQNASPSMATWAIPRFRLGTNKAFVLPALLSKNLATIKTFFESTRGALGLIAWGDVHLFEKDVQTLCAEQEFVSWAIDEGFPVWKTPSLFIDMKCGNLAMTDPPLSVPYAILLWNVFGQYKFEFDVTEDANVTLTDEACRALAHVTLYSIGEAQFLQSGVHARALASYRTC